MAIILRKYGTGTGADIYVPIIKRDAVDFAVSADWTPAAGDVKVSKDGGAAANIGTLPTAVTMGNTAMWKFVFSDAELQCKYLSVSVADSATKAVEDQFFAIETYGHASAMYQADLSAANLPAKLGDVAHGGSSATLTFERLIAASTTTNEPAVKLSGNGTAAGLQSTGGATGSGAKFIGGGTSGYSIHCTTTSGAALYLNPTDGPGLSAQGESGGNAGIRAEGAANGPGLQCLGGSTQGPGIYASGSTLGHGVELVAAGASRYPISALSAASFSIAGVTIQFDGSGYHKVSEGTGTGQIPSSMRVFWEGIEDGTAQAGGSTTITLASGESSIDDYYNGSVIFLTGGTGAKQYRQITDYDGMTKVATVDSAWGTNPDSSTTYQIMGRIV